MFSKLKKSLKKIPKPFTKYEFLWYLVMLDEKHKIVEQGWLSEDFLKILTGLRREVVGTISESKIRLC